MHIKLLFLFLIVFGFVFSQNKSSYLELNPKPGLHKGIEEVKVNIIKGATVYYTTDGSLPNRSSKKLTTTLLTLKGNSVFRFVIYHDNKTEHVTASYFIERDHSLPVISLVTDATHLFDSITGIYAMGCCADTINPYMGANFWQDWERPVNIEFFEPDGRIGFNQPAGIKIFGGYSKALRQKSFAIIARKKYGSNKFKHEIFPQLPFKSYKSIILRNAGGDMIGAHIRDVYATQLLKPTGLLIQEYRPAAVYLNGHYWGKYNIREKINEHFIHAHFGYPKDSLIIMRHNGDHQHGPPGDYRKFIRRMNSVDMNKREDLAYVDSKIDIQNYMLYNIAEVYTGNGDAGGNIRYYKSMRDTAKWRWIFYDLDHGMNINSSEDYKINSLFNFTTYKDETWPNPPWSTLIIRKILENDSLKYCYINKFSDLLNTTFHANRSLALIDSLTREVSEEIDHHLKRWKILRKRYDQSVEDLRLFAKKRPIILWEHLKERFDLGEKLEVTIDFDGKFGWVQFNSLELTKRFKGTYFQGIPFYIKAIPFFDNEFLGWKEVNSNRSTRYERFNEQKVILTPLFRERKPSDYLGKIIITEVDASQDGESNDWIELYNNSDQLIDLSNWQVRDEKDDHVFYLPDNTVILPKSFIIVAQDDSLFNLTYSDSSLIVVGGIGFGFRKNRDRIRLYDVKGNRVDWVNLADLGQPEKGGLNWSRNDFRVSGFYQINWELERPTPGSISLSYQMRLEQEANDNWWRKFLIYSGSGLGILVLIVFFFSLYSKKQQSINE